MSDGVKPVECIDCGKTFYVSALNSKTKYCDDCKRDYQKQKTKMRVKNYRNNQNVTLSNS